MSTNQTTIPMLPEDFPPQEMLLRMIAGFWISRAIYVAAKLGLADLVASQPRTVEELAEATGTHAPSLYRVLRALSSVGIFATDERGRFALTPLAATLQTDAPGSLRPLAISELGEEHYAAWGEVLHSVRTGGIAFDQHFGMNVWEYFAQNPDNAATFNDSMTTLTAAVTDAILLSYDFSSIQKLVDVGGGHGQFLMSILKAYPQMRGILFDAHRVVEGATERLAAEGLVERCEIVGGDFFESVPEGGDAYVLKWIIHDWDDERSIRILKNCHRAMPENARLLLIETVIPPSDEPHLGKFIDLNMLVMTGGCERTAAEFHALFDAAGFDLSNIAPTPSPMSIIEGRRR